MHKKTVLVTGASRGIGRAIAMTFAQNNYHVFLNCRHSISELESVKSAIEAIPYGSCDIFIGDVGNPHSVKELYEMIYTKYDCLDVLVNNAGIAHIGLLSDMVNAIACGAIETSMNAQLSAEEKSAFEEEIPAGRFGTPQEVADLVWNLVNSPSYLTGQIIGLDGGYI